MAAQLRAIRAAYQGTDTGWADHYFYDFNDRRWIMEGRAKVAEILARRGDLDKAEKLIAENRKWNPSWGPCRPAETAVAEMRRAKVLAASK